jgi:hypothetical protein
MDRDATDPLAAESLALAGLASAAVQGRSALGPCAGARVERHGHDPDAPWVESSSPLQARCDGFDLHAGVTVAIAQERLARTADGRVLLTLEGRVERRHHLPAVRASRAAGTVAALTPRPPSPSCCTCSRHTVGGGLRAGRLRARHARPARPRAASRVRCITPGGPTERVWVVSPAAARQPASAMSVEDPPPRTARARGPGLTSCATRSRWTSWRASPPRLPTAGDRPKVCKRRFPSHAELHALASAQASAASKPEFFPSLSCTLSLTARHRACYVCVFWPLTVAEVRRPGASAEKAARPSVT